MAENEIQTRSTKEILKVETSGRSVGNPDASPIAGQEETSQTYEPKSPATVQAGIKSSNVVELSKGAYPDRFQRLNTLLGKGANKEVFLAFDTLKTQDVAWNRVARQQLSQADQNLLQKEIAMMDKANHPNIIKYLAWWETENYFVFITDFFNMSLKKFIQERNVLINSVKTWTSQILDGLIHLHEHDIIHRDVKCDNVFINQKSGDVVIGDLGLSRTAKAMDRSMSMVGTVPFMAPEQLNLEARNYDTKVDIYALGMTVLEMISGEYPFEECNALPYIIKNIIDDKPPDTLNRLKDGPTKNFVILCLTREPEERPSASALRKHAWFVHNKENFPVAILMGEENPEEPTIRPDNAGVVDAAPQEFIRSGTFTGDTIKTPPEEVILDQEQVTEVVDAAAAELQKFEASIQSMKIKAELLKQAERSKLPADIQEETGDVDQFVEEFVNNSSVAGRSNFQDDAVHIFEKWETRRKKIQEWSKEKETELESRAGLIKSQEVKLDQERKKLEVSSQEEIDVRKNLNHLHNFRMELNEQVAEIDKKIQELKDSREQILDQFKESETKSAEMESKLREVMLSRTGLEQTIDEIEGGLEDLKSDSQFESDKEQVEQLLNWKSTVENVMNEIQKARELEWKKWGPTEIVDWICRLDQGTFKVYKEKLETEVPTKLDTGEDLLFLLQDRQTIGELGVSKIRHRDMLIKHIERLNFNNPSDVKSQEKADVPHV